jgi:hypothetical protein
MGESRAEQGDIAGVEGGGQMRGAGYKTCKKG